MRNFLRRLYLKITGLTLTAAFAFAVPAGAQIAPGVQNSAQKTAVIVGTVVDTKGAPVNGANVLLNGPNASLRTRTDAAGGFQYLNVPFGTYSIFVDAPRLG